MKSHDYLFIFSFLIQCLKQASTVGSNVVLDSINIHFEALETCFKIYFNHTLVG